MAEETLEIIPAQIQPIALSSERESHFLQAANSNHILLVFQRNYWFSNSSAWPMQRTVDWAFWEYSRCWSDVQHWCWTVNILIDNERWQGLELLAIALRAIT